MAWRNSKFHSNKLMTLKRFIIYVVISFILTILAIYSQAVTNNSFGSISIRDNNVMWITWTNAPATVIVQHSTNMMNWSDVLYVGRMGSNSNLQFFEYSLPLNITNSLFVRLRTQ